MTSTRNSVLKLLLNEDRHLALNLVPNLHALIPLLESLCLCVNSTLIPASCNCVVWEAAGDGLLLMAYSFLYGESTKQPVKGKSLPKTH